MTDKTKRVVTSVISILVTLASVLWIYFREFNQPKYNVALHRRIGQVMAEETARLVDNKGKIVLVAIDTGEPELKTQLSAFKEKLKKLGAMDLKEYELDTKDQPKYGIGMGLSGRRFVRIVNKNENAAAIVSFVGAPKISDEDATQLTKVPKFIAEARSPDHLPALFAKKLIQVAVVSRFQFPAPGPLNPRTPDEWFTKRYQIIRADTAASLPETEKAE